MNNNDMRKFALLSLLLVAFIWFAAFGESYTIGPNYRNISVDTTVNITNALPEILSVVVNNNQNVTLTAGSSTFVECNVSVRDYDGGATISVVNATFFDNTTVTHLAADDNNTHYTNGSCTQNAVSGFYANYTCGFFVQYYANATNPWICNATAHDSYDFNGSDYDADYNTTAINTLLALNVTTLIDYGNLAVLDTSTPQEANVTNFGNVPINVSVYGYGNVSGDGLAMVCDVGSIAIANEKYSLVSGADFTSEYTSLTGVDAQIANLTIAHQTDDVTPSLNNTYWRLYVPPNPSGVCNGTVVFQAESAT